MLGIQTIEALILRGTESATAIAAPGRPPLTYGALRHEVAKTAAALRQLGIGRGDRVAIVLPNGPEMAVAFVAIAAAATTAPLNPAYRENEFAFYLSDLQPKLVVVEAGSDTPARQVAEQLAIRVVELDQSPGAAAGQFDLRGAQVAKGSDPQRAQAEDVALILHTSGTTSRPKMVPLSQANLCSSAIHIARSLALTGDDRCLNIMPLFHIHGLMAAVLSSLAAGAAVFASPGFSAMKFFSWMKEADPTWCTAVPTMYQAILGRAPRNQEALAGGFSLRFLRSSSASLPPRVMRELEDTFSVPVIESYGMTEAAHQMASNPLPPGERKPGTVGLPAGPEIAVLGPGGERLPAGAVGEVVIRGPSVTRGYLGNPEANEAALIHGWFRTGDQGVFDEAGYLRLTGRVKEIINRGGEKISPREVDEVLMEHPAVQQVVAFAMPHDKLGEEVAAAVILRPGNQATERDLRQFAGERLADFKVPRRIVFVDEIPKGPTGKLQRIGLAEKLGLGSANPRSRSATDLSTGPKDPS